MTGTDPVCCFPSPDPYLAPHLTHLGKGNEEELVVCVLEAVQRVLRAVLPHPLLIGLGVHRVGNGYAHLLWTLPLLHPPASQLLPRMLSSGGQPLPYPSSFGHHPPRCAPSLVTLRCTVLGRLTTCQRQPSRRPSLLSCEERVCASFSQWTLCQAQTLPLSRPELSKMRKEELLCL
jgi:hypothetical protein